MASPGRPVLGIDINQYEIRVVEMRGAGIAAQVVRAGSVPLPRGAVDGDRINYHDAVGETLKGLLSRMNVSTRAAVFGVGSRSTITRVLDIPRVPDTELRMVLEGELAHYQILREDTGVFDYTRLHDSTGSGDSNPQVLLMAVEDKVVNDYRDVCDRAGLHFLALEPVMLSLYRAAFQQVQAQPSAVCLNISYGKTEIAIVDHGRIRLYRRIDIGSDDLVLGRRASATEQEADNTRKPTLLGDDEEKRADSTMPAVMTTGGISNSVAGSLATELQRSLDYYRREFPQAPAVSRTILATHDPDIEPLADWLKQALALEVTLAEPPISIGVSRAIAAQLEETEGLRFVAACGLAMHGLPGMSPSIPVFNLGAIARPQAVTSAGKSRMVASIAASVAILVCGLAVGMWLRSGVVQKEGQLTQMQHELTQQQQAQLVMIQRNEGTRRNLDILRKEGFPLPLIMDTVAARVAAGTSMADLTLTPDGMIAINGEALTASSMIQTYQGIQTCPQFWNTTINQFDTKDADKQKYVSFKLTTQLRSSAMALMNQPQASPGSQVP
jgi:type IV pilus assembly protein PilM